MILTALQVLTRKKLITRSVVTRTVVPPLKANASNGSVDKMARKSTSSEGSELLKFGSMLSDSYHRVEKYSGWEI